MKLFFVFALLLSGLGVARTLPRKEAHRLPRWYCTAQTPDDEHVNHSTVATTEHAAKRNATKECRHFHPDSAGCRVRCWKL